MMNQKTMSTLFLRLFNFIERQNCRICFVILLIPILSGLTFAQNNTLSCKIAATSYNDDDNIVTLGNFTGDFIKEKSVIKSFKFPESNLFVTAGYTYNPDILGNAANQGNSIVLMVFLGKNAFKFTEDELKSNDTITNATTIIPTKSFENATVHTLYVRKRQPIIISMECERQ